VSQRTLRWLWLALAALPAGFPLILILQYGVNFHYWDEWDPEVVGVYIKGYQHQLTLADLLAQHNEHRLLVPRLFHLLLNLFSQWNERVAMLGGWVVVCATSLGILLLIHQTVDAGTLDESADASRWRRIAWRWFLCNLLIFTPAQLENWLSGWGFDNALPMAFITFAIVVAVSRLSVWIKLSLCLVLAAAASFSNGCGFAVWPLVGMLLAWSTSREELRAKTPVLVVWGIGFLLVAGIYFHGYESPPHMNAYDLTQDRFIFYMVAFLANAFVFSTGFAWTQSCFLIGAVMLLLFLACVQHFVRSLKSEQREQLCRPMLIWFAIAGFSLLTSLMGAMSRAGFGYGQATISRYVTFSVYLAVALVSLVPMVCGDIYRHESAKARWIQLPAFLGAAMGVLLVLVVPSSLNMAKAIQSQRLAGKAALLLINVLPDNPQIPSLIYQNKQHLSDEANTLNMMGYLQPKLIAGDDANRILDVDLKSADSVTGQFTGIHQDGSGYVATGWAIAPADARAADAVFLTYEDANGEPIIFAQAQMGVAQTDIAEKYGEANYAYCGWMAAISAIDLPGDLKTPRITAWALDTQTGTATPLNGQFYLSQ
jgi:hypothetical protein